MSWQNVLVCLGLLLNMPAMCLHSLAAADPVQNEDGEQTADKADSPLRNLFRESLTWDEIFVSDQATTGLKPRVAMRWANNARGSASGLTVLYVSEGRPEVVCSIYPWDKHLVHEYDSLSRARPIVKREGRVVWTPDQPGISFKRISDAEPPAETAIGRLRQMKSLSRDFSATMLGWKADRSDREELRLLPQPLYRYDSQRADVLDGAVFAFTQGTDPESLLLLEAYTVGGAYEWQFAFVRNTSGELEGRYHDSVVWHADRFPVSNNPKDIHFSLYRPLAPSVLAELK